MELYYKAINIRGDVVHGRVVANDKSEAARYLRIHDIYPIKIEEEGRNQFSTFLPFFSRSSAGDLIFFTTQMSSMLQSGLSLMQALQVMRNQTRNQYMSEVIQGIVSEVQDGHSFAQALSNYPKMFSPIYVSMVRAGEKSGLLDKVLTRLASNLEKSKEIKDDIRAALIYPIIIIILMIVVIGVMLVFVVPQLSSLYTSMNLQLPIMTQFVIALSNGFVTGLPVIILGFIFGVFLYRRWYHTSRGRLLIDQNIIKIPLVGKLISESVLIEFSRTFGLLVGTGGLVIDSLKQCADTVGNAYYKEAVLDVSSRVEKGVRIGDAMDANEVFPSMLVEMTKIGEQSGKLEESLLRVSEYYEREVSHSVKALTSAIEPIILVVLGVSVGFLIISIITPIYGLLSSIH